MECALSLCFCLSKVFKDVCNDTIANPDVKPIMGFIITAYTDPVGKTTEALDKLMMTTFVSTVDAPTLGLLCPMLRRGMMERKAEFKRKAALVIGNLCKLVVDPRFRHLCFAGFSCVTCMFVKAARSEATTTVVEDRL